MIKVFFIVAPKLNIYYNLCFKCETMIAYLSGKLLEKQANTVIVETNGVGYEVSIPLSTFYEIGEVGSEIQLRIYTHVREDALQLYGFKTLRERELFIDESEAKLFEKVQAQQEKEIELEQREEDLRARERRLREREAAVDPQAAAALKASDEKAKQRDEFNE